MWAARARAWRLVLLVWAFVWSLKRRFPLMLVYYPPQVLVRVLWQRLSASATGLLGGEPSPLIRFLRLILLSCGLGERCKTPYSFREDFVCVALPPRVSLISKLTPVFLFDRIASL